MHLAYRITDSPDFIPEAAATPRMQSRDHIKQLMRHCADCCAHVVQRIKSFVQRVSPLLYYLYYLLKLLQDVLVPEMNTSSRYHYSTIYYTNLTAAGMYHNISFDQR
jgi:hypothetical protein